MKRIKITSEQFNELQRQQQVRDYSQRIERDLSYLSSILNRNNSKELIECMNVITILKEKAIQNITNMISWEIEDD